MGEAIPVSSTPRLLILISGVPKFFRWMSERYPAISQLIAENRIPEFDCLYVGVTESRAALTGADTDNSSI